ncbi:MAG: hypothetical protein QGF21_07270 [Vicinamibacterales bacterium]|nr:hypothetical protein [Acidobacteriota bacterium]MDP7671726.1 hypothetical protein [Vicinamibacterales bacterium]HJO39538.1 hypothetical protein [Vicinamibacterales bacterium]
MIVSNGLYLHQLERRPLITFAAIGCGLAVAYTFAVTLFPSADGRIIEGDAVQYYAYLRSLVFDQDVNFINDYQLLYASDGSSNVWLDTTTETGHAVNLMSIGPALLWLPFFLVACGVVALLRTAGAVIAFDGISAPFQLSAGLAGIAYATLGAYLCYRACARFWPPAASLWGTLVAWLATPAIYYSLVSPAYSHATSLFVVALFVWTWLRTAGDNRASRYALLGAIVGLAALVRWQNVTILILPMTELVRELRDDRTSLRSAAVQVGVLGAASLAAFLPQMFAWKQIYGHWLLTPQGEGFMRWMDPQIGAVLFSLNHGLFSWTPAVLVAVFGLAVLVARYPLVGWNSVAVVLIAVYINASVADWWAGEAYGARRFIGSTPFFALGLAALFSTTFWTTRARLLRATAACLIVYNLLFLAQYQLFMRGYEGVPYPVTAKQILIDRLIVPWRAIGAAFD